MERKESSTSLPPNELLQKAREYHYRDALPPEEYEALMHLGPELLPPQTCDAQCFILGSYQTDELQRLRYLQQEIEQREGGNYRAFLMEDLPDGLHPIVKFKLIADYSDYIIGVCEHDSGGFQLELGMLIVLMEYFDQSYLLKRSYSNPVEREKYNWMLSKGAFEIFDYNDRLQEWEDVEEFKVEVTNLLWNVL